MPSHEAAQQPVDLREAATASAARVARSDDLIGQSEEMISKSTTTIARTRHALARIEEKLKRGG